MTRPWWAENLKAVLFDFGGTLDADGLAWRERFFPLYRRAGLRWDFKKFERCFFAADDFLTGIRPERLAYRDMLKLQVSMVLREGGRFSEPLAARIADRFHKDSLASLRRKEPFLRKLARRYRLGVVANFYGNIEALLEETGLRPLFGVVADSGRLGWLKPDPRIFRSALKILKATPGQALMVGDSVKRDMAGAKLLGMPHVWVRHPHGEWKASCCPEDPSVRSVLELAGPLLG